MAKTTKVHEDTGSDEVELMRLQLNRLTAFVEALKAAAATDGNTFQTNVAALTADADFESIILSVQRPPAPKISI